MPYQVQVGAQVVEFPDSVSQNEAQRILADQFPATGEDISLAMQDPAFKPTQQDYLKFEEYSKNKQTDWINTAAQAADAAIGMISGAVSEGAQGAAANPLNYLEGFVQGGRQLYGLVAQSQDPESALFKFKDLVAGTGTPESRYQQFLEARDFANTTARLERGEEGLVVPPELTNPEYVQGVSMILDPTLFVPGVGEILGTGKLATRAVGKGAQLTGRAIAGAARPLERFAGAAERIAAETIGTTPESLRNTAATAGIAGALGIAPEAAAFAAIPAGIRTAREAGEALTRAGENLMTQPSRIGPLEAIGAASGANLRQRMLGVVGQYGGDAALDASLRGIAGGIEGAAIGTGLGYLSGGQEGAAAGFGSGGVQGAAGALGGRMFQKLTGRAAKEARAGDLGRFIDAQQDPTTKALFQQLRDRHGVDAASSLMDLQGLVRGKFGDVEVEYLSSEDFAKRYQINARGVQVENKGGRPAVVINADIIGKGTGDGPLYTLGHELFHALEKTTQLEGGATEIKDALVGRWIQEGDTIRKLAEGAFNDAEIEAKFNEYRDKLGAGNDSMAAELAKYDTVNKKADYVASELAAEHFAGLLAGQKPDALLKGFTGLTRQLIDLALTQNASRALADAAATIERTFGVKPTDSVLFPDLKQASPQVNAMLRDLLRARRKLDEKIKIQGEKTKVVLKPEDVSNPLAAKQLVELGLAEQMPDGTIRSMSSEEVVAREDKDRESLRAIIENTPGTARMVDGVAQGRLSPEQLSAIEQSQAVSSRMKDKIRAANAAMDAGNSLNITYSAALKKIINRLTGKKVNRYSSGIRLTDRDVLPYAFYFSQADHPLIKAIDISKVRDAILKDTASNGSVGKGLWDNVDGFMGDLAKYFTNLDQKEGARRSAEIFGLEKAKYLGDFINQNEKFVRDFRLDRIGSVAPSGFRARFSEEAYQLSKQRWMPAEKLGDKSVINSEEGYRIISGAKHKLYGPDGKLVGIYDTQTQAERKADATQARLQPEVRQQQYPARDEVRQAAEAGGRNRAVGGQEGQAEGGAVRQAGDVRFMPEGKSAGLAVLDNELALNLPKRPKVLDIANAFQDLFGKAIEYRKSNPQDNAKLVKSLAQEIQRAVDLHPEAKGWYDENIKLTMDVMRDLDSDLAKPENDFMFKVILAATSDGNKVGPQFQQTWKEYSNWKNTGKISGDFVSGDRIENIKGNLKMFNEMVNAIGWEKTKDFFTRKGTVKEVRQALMDTFGWTKKEAQGVGSSELTDEVVPFAVVLGPKLGSFFNNLYGDFSSVTMDRWFMRTIGRLTGTQVEPLAGSKVREMRNNLRDAVSRLTPSQFELLGIKRGDLKGTSIDDAATTISGRFAKKSLRDTAKQFAESGESALQETRKFANALKKGLNPLVEAPVDGTHRRWIRERIAEVQKDLRSSGIELENADLQAVLWYLEKELYEKLNYRSKSGESDYASAASALYQSVAGRPSDVYARGTGRVRAIGGDGRGNVLDTANGGQAPRQEVSAQRYMPDQQGFYSKLEEVVNAKLPKIASPQQVLASVDPAKGSGVKPEELKWTGFAQAVERIAKENGGKIPKDKLIEHLNNEGSVNFEEVTFGTIWNVGDSNHTERYTNLKDALSAKEDVIDFLKGEFERGWSVEEQDDGFVVVDEYGDRIREQRSESGRVVWKPSIYRSESEANAAIKEGAKDLAEVYVVFNENQVQGSAIHADYQLPGGENYREVVLTSDTSVPYTSTHYTDIENYVAHMRLNDRTATDGRDGLFIEEIQSDRHQKARTQGYKEDKGTDWSKVPVYQYKDLVAEGVFPNALHIEVKDGIYKLVAPDGNVHLMESSLEKLKKNYDQSRMVEGVSDAPFRKDWSLQMFKRALRDAVASGKKWIGWTTGVEQVKRYENEFRKSVDTIQWNDEGLKHNVVAIKDGKSVFSGRFDLDGKGLQLFNGEEASLSDVVGKDIAAQIIKGEGKASGVNQAEWSGSDITIGGEGMKGFYDKILPAEVQKYVKQWDGKVSKSNIPEAAIWRVDITPEMRKSVSESGQPRFMPDYSGEHRAPKRDSGAPLDNLKDVYPDDVYGPNAARYYGHESGSQTDKAAVRILQATKGKPDAPVKVFRAIPKSIQSNEINPGDWITTIKSYAVQHGEGALGGDYKILEKTVPAGDLYTNGDSIFEFGYDPQFMPSPDSAMPGAYSFPGGFRAIPGKTKGSLRLYGPAGSLIGIASSLDEAQRILRRKAKQ